MNQYMKITLILPFKDFLSSKIDNMMNDNFTWGSLKGRQINGSLLANCGRINKAGCFDTCTH